MGGVGCFSGGFFGAFRALEGQFARRIGESLPGSIKQCWNVIKMPRLCNRNTFKSKSSNINSWLRHLKMPTMGGTLGPWLCGGFIWVLGGFCPLGNGKWNTVNTRRQRGQQTKGLRRSDWAEFAIFWFGSKQYFILIWLEIFISLLCASLLFKARISAAHSNSFLRCLWHLHAKYLKSQPLKTNRMR